jgi:hypothetical protein
MTPIALLHRVLGTTLLLVLVACFSCKKDEPSPVGPPGGGGGGGTISDSLRAIVLDSLLSRINQLPQVNRDADNQTIYQYVLSRPEFGSSGVTSSGVWAKFRDGRVWRFVNNLYGLDTSWTQPTPTLKVTSSPRSTLIPSEDLPQNNGARVMNALGSAFDYSGSGQLSFTEAANDIRSWLQQAGYTPVNSMPTVDELKTVSNDGVFYMSSHGAFDYLPDSSVAYGLWTATKATIPLDGVYKNDLDSGRLTYWAAPHIKPPFQRIISETHYVITPKFVLRYMGFGPRSVVFINACKSGDSEFRDACIFKGADLYFGWSGNMDALRGIRIAHFLFDRALGANVERPVLSPPQKGYQLYDVFGFMHTTDRDFTMLPDYGRADLLQYPPALASVTMLRPLIYSVTASQYELRILGWFGANPGVGAATVQVGNTVVPIRFGSWTSASTLICDPVQDGGDVVVTVRGRKSKPVPLTKFSGSFDYTLHGRGTLTKHVSVSFDFLADVRTNRTRVDEDPQWELPRNIFPIQTTGASYQASGEYRDNQGNLVETWGGSGGLVLLPPGTSGIGVSVSGIINRTTFPVQSNISVGVTAPYQNNGNASTFQIEYNVGSLQTQMNDYFTIPGATYTGGSGSESATGTFTNITSTFAPTGSTVR